MIMTLPDSGQAGAKLDVAPAMIEAGIKILRDWLSENWSEIRDGAEPGIAATVQEMLSLGHIHKSQRH